MDAMVTEQDQIVRHTGLRQKLGRAVIERRMKGGLAPKDRFGYADEMREPVRRSCKPTAYKIGALRFILAFGCKVGQILHRGIVRQMVHG